MSEQGVEVLGTAPDHASAADLALISLPSGGSLVVTGSFFHLAGVRDRLVDQAAEATQSTPR